MSRMKLFAHAATSRKLPQPGRFRSGSTECANDLRFVQTKEPRGRDCRAECAAGRRRMPELVMRAADGFPSTDPDLISRYDCFDQFTTACIHGLADSHCSRNDGSCRMKNRRWV